MLVGKRRPANVWSANVGLPFTLRTYAWAGAIHNPTLSYVVSPIQFWFASIGKSTFGSSRNLPARRATYPTTTCFYFAYTATIKAEHYFYYLIGHRGKKNWESTVCGCHFTYYVPDGTSYYVLRSSILQNTIITCTFVSNAQQECCCPLRIMRAPAYCICKWIRKRRRWVMDKMRDIFPPPRQICMCDAFSIFLYFLKGKMF